MKGQKLARQHLRAGYFIQAIKYLRACNNISLKEAKDTVERWQANDAKRKTKNARLVKAGRLITNSMTAPAAERAKAEPNTTQRDVLISHTIERLRNRGGWWEGDPNARKVLAEMLQIAAKQKTK